MKQRLKKLGLISAGILLLSIFFVLLGSVLFAFLKPQLAITILTRLIPEEKVSPVAIKGIAIIGDSQADEYRADDSRGLTYASTTRNWVEQLQLFRNLNFGPWETNPEPRRSGYAYNFARTGATVASMLASGQHTGVADEVKKGKVNVVIIAIGANDYAPYITADGYDALYNGTVPQAQILQKKNRIVADITTAVDTIREAGSVRMILVTIPDWGHHLGVRVAFPLPEPREKVTEIIAATNSDLRKMARDRGITVLDTNAFYTSVFSASPTEIRVGAESFNAVLPGDDPHSIFLEDATHAGTVLNGLFANAMIAKFNEATGATIKPFSDQEILSHAGL